jgi:uncharacterized Ntn-hydrolase superfamily protein
VTIEQRILTLAESPDCNHPRELRAIALEVRKREDRIKQLEEKLMHVMNKHAMLVADVVLYEDRAERIKQLEEENDAMRADLLLWKDWVEEERGKQ